MAAKRALGFLGRASERATLDRLLSRVRDGQSAALVIRGEAGIGKTALMASAAQRASGFRVVQIDAVEAEMELPFAALHQLCGPMFAQIEDLPEPQRNALEVAFGRSFGTAPDRFLIGLAMLSLVSAVAEQRPLLCVVDDAQWLDQASEQILGFVARRVFAESVGLIFAIREPHPNDAFAGLPELPLAGLAEQDARTLLARASPGRIDDQVRDRLIAEAQGNPLALLELTQDRSAADLGGGFELPASEDLPNRIEDRYLGRFGVLPERTRRLLLIAAADPLGDASLVWRAAERSGITAIDLEPAEEAGLLAIAVRVRFCHPLARSAVYRAASPADRRRAHALLAEVSDPDLDADRRAWHHALAAAGPDEDVAAELERSAGRAQTRGGIAAAATFLERSAALSDDQAHRSRRALAAAHARHQAGGHEVAHALLARARAGPLDPLQRVQAELLSAQMMFTSNRGREAPVVLLHAAKQLEALDAPLARETYLEALMAAQFAGRYGGRAALEVATATRTAPRAPAPRAADLLLDALATMIIDGHTAAAPQLRRVVETFRRGDLDANGGFRWLWLAEAAAIELWDHEGWDALAGQEVQLVRAAGVLTVLPLSLSAAIVARIFAGELAAAESLIEEVELVTDATGSHLAPYGSLILAAWRGQEADHARLAESTLRQVSERGEGIGVSTVHWTNALLSNGLGRYETAMAAAQRVLEPVGGRLDATINWALPELAEAAVRCGRGQFAYDAVEQLSEMTRASGTDWAVGLEARSHALLSGREAAEELYREAVDRLSRTRQRGDHARAQLLYGEWLRREGRRKDARDHLRDAHATFVHMGAEAFAERTRRELSATGETVRKPSIDTGDQLTAQERQISRLAVEGLSNPEIGARLFLSPRTVEWHLRKVFAKLGIRSRRELAKALPRIDSGLVDV